MRTFFEIVGKFSEKKVAKIKKKILGNFWWIPNEIYKKLEINLNKILGIFGKNFENFKENFWKLWLTDCENVEMWRNFNKN